MFSNKSTLLTLPRELRNEIYRYLYHEKRCSGYFPGSPSGHSSFTVDLLIENAPLSSVLLVNNQIRCEYLESDCFVALRATIRCGQILFKDMFDKGQICPNFDKALAHVHHLTISTHAPGVSEFSGCRFLLANALMLKALNLSSMRFILETQYLPLEEDKDLQALLRKSLAVGFPRNYVLMPKHIANMSLEQHGHGYYVSDLGLAYNACVFNGAPDKYDITGFQVLLYARHNALPASHCRFDDVLENLIELAPGSRDSIYDMEKDLNKEIGVLEWIETVCGKDDTESWFSSA